MIHAAGDAHIDSASPDRYDFERVSQPASHVAKLLTPLAAAPGFRGVLVFGSDDGTSSVVVYRFEHEADFDAFRESTPALASLGPVGATGGVRFAVHPIKTFGPDS